ncbi:hypothetical protein TURU_031655 [Turdus rufiventris]|nr:hypothetical protein TURU_031655 [Turdus rufiventris]
MTYTEKLHRSSYTTTILKQQWQVSTGAIKLNKNTPRTAYSSVFSLAHRSLKPLARAKDSIAVHTVKDPADFQEIPHFDSKEKLMAYNQERVKSAKNFYCKLGNQQLKTKEEELEAEANTKMISSYRYDTSTSRVQYSSGYHARIRGVTQDVFSQGLSLSTHRCSEEQTFMYFVPYNLKFKATKQFYPKDGQI